MLRVRLFLCLFPFFSGATFGQVFTSHALPMQQKINFVEKPAEQKVEVYIGGQLFCNYFYPDSIAKPILYPIYSSGGKAITRGFPIYPNEGERADHPHQIGYWLNYGDVNGLDFWNNSLKHGPEKENRYGRIFHQKILRTEEEEGILEIETLWKTPEGQTLLQEKTSFIFSQNGNTRIIDRKTELNALKDIRFTDNKEGMLAIRVHRSLELPSNKPTLLIDENGRVRAQKVVDSTGVTGTYHSSEGIQGANVWGKRAKWMLLQGEIEEAKIALAIMDHPDNIGFPTYWHARAYGLFSANPLGQAIFSKGTEELNFHLPKGEKVTFRYRLVIHEGAVLTKAMTENLYQEWMQE